MKALEPMRWGVEAVAAEGARITEYDGISTAYERATAQLTTTFADF